jgi:intermediate cleaving peptidase 55
MRSSLCAFRSFSLARSRNVLHTRSNCLSGIPGRLYASISAADLKFGQPLHETHAHLLGAGERESVRLCYECPVNTCRIPVTPGISALEYATRRTKLAAHLPDNAIAVLASSDIKYRSGTVFYEFHQNPDFFYLTGMNLPSSF